MHDSSKAIADGILNHLLLLFGGDPTFDLLALTTEHPHMMQLRPNSPIKYSLADEDFMKFRLFYSFLFTFEFLFCLLSIIIESCRLLRSFKPKKGKRIEENTNGTLGVLFCMHTVISK